MTGSLVSKQPPAGASASGEWNVRDFGAVSGTDATAAFQRAIDACAKHGGGRVVCGPGVWKIGSIDMRTNVEIHLQCGCRIEAGTSLDDYHPLTAPGFRHEAAPEKSAHALFRGIGIEHAAITGNGIIDGNGLAFYDLTAGDGKLPKPPTPRPRLGMFYDCRDIRIEGVTFVDSACWTLWFMQCENVRVHRVTITGNRRMRNVDGIDVDACRNVLISDCIMDTEDDCIAVRAIQGVYEKPAVCENVAVANCILHSACQGVRVGCPADGVIRNCSFQNLIIDCDGDGVLFEFPRRYLPPDGAAGADVSNIRFSNLTVNSRRHAVRILVEDGVRLTRVEKIDIDGLRANSRRAGLVIAGNPETPVRDVRIAHAAFESADPEGAVLMKHCERLRMDDVEVSAGPR